LVRELREELGIDVAEPKGECLLHVEGDRFDMSVWLVTDWLGEPSNAAPEEHDDIGWFSVGEVQTLSLAHPRYPSLIASALAES
jgi:8-oxo-dGTP diphosphatase